MKKLKTNNRMSDITKAVIADYNSMTEKEFWFKYRCTKKTYYRRVRLYRDPYMYAPLAIIGKLLGGKSIFK